MSGPFFITQHAVERFRERFAGGLSHNHALRELIVLSQSACRLRERTQSGEEQWESGGIVFVVKNDPKFGKTCVTIQYSEIGEIAE